VVRELGVRGGGAVCGERESSGGDDRMKSVWSTLFIKNKTGMRRRLEPFMGYICASIYSILLTCVTFNMIYYVFVDSCSLWMP
jgi:hypothetical protein